MSRGLRRIRVAALPSRGEVLYLSPADLHHLRGVLRLAVGARFVAFADGYEVEVELTADGTARVCTEARAVPPPSPLHLVFALPKGAPLDHLLRMSVEVGATHLHPVISDRTIPKGDHPERWARILVGAAAQCGRADVPVLSPLRPLSETATLIHTVVRWIGVPGAPAARASSASAALAVGPEGGFSPREIETLIAAGWNPAGFGPYVLRVDTAAAIGLAVLRAASSTDDG